MTLILTFSFFEKEWLLSSNCLFVYVSNLFSFVLYVGGVVGEQLRAWTFWRRLTMVKMRGGWRRRGRRLAGTWSKSCSSFFRSSLRYSLTSYSIMVSLGMGKVTARLTLSLSGGKLQVLTDSQLYVSGMNVRNSAGNVLELNYALIAGATHFLQLLRSMEKEDEEVGRLSDQIRAHFLPLMTAPVHSATGPSWTPTMRPHSNYFHKTNYFLIKNRKKSSKKKKMSRKTNPCNATDL